MKAVIITIGDEILIGQTIDTNAAWLGQSFNKRGIEVEKIISIRDRTDSIHHALNEAFALAEIVVMTGGLGPTLDDITKQALCDYFDTKLVLSEESLSNVKHFVESRGFQLNENNYNQAMVPETCTVLTNHLGTAPIMQFEKEGSYLFSMPGVPFEMKHAMEYEVFPIIESHFSLSPVFHQTIMTFGMPEAFLAEKLNAWVSELPEYVKIAYLPSPKGIKIRMSVYDTMANSDYEAVVKENVAKLHDVIPEIIFSDTESPLENVLYQHLKERGLKLSTAESCTGGMIGSVMTSIPGSSEVFEGGIIAYSNAIKSQVLAVSDQILEEDGAVSQACVVQMSKSVQEIFHTDCSVAVSGIAGPSGGTKEKPVGTVWIAVRLGNDLNVRKFEFGSNRAVNTKRAAYSAMNMMLRMLIDSSY